MRGVTIIELMVVVTIIGVLTAISIPLYGMIYERVRRTDAIGGMQTIAVEQESFFTSNNTYTADFSALGFPGGMSRDGHYQFEFTGAPDTMGWELTARPVIGGAQESDAPCQWFRLNRQQVKTSGPNPDCWPD